MSEPGRRAACFILRVKPELLEQYRSMHSPVWPEMLSAIRDAGWSNYSIFDRGDGIIVGYFETDDLDAARSRIDASDVARRWGEATAHLFAERQEWLAPVFNLDDQLRASGQSVDPQRV